MVLELAVASEASGIVTFNRRDFKGIEAWGLKVYSPQEFLTILGGRK
jgi:predicted nucleic acid-binding protein